MMINALTIAGTDPTGGAGVQADLKAFSALGAYGMSVMTALVAQNTQGVDSLHPIPLDFIEAQFDSVLNDVRVDVIKVGALIDQSIVERVATMIEKRAAEIPLILDTVMIAKGGHPLLEASAITAIRDQMLPLSTLITPNLPEAAALLGTTEATTEAEMIEQGRALLALGPKAVLMKGGHLTLDESPDYLITHEGERRYSTPRVATKNSHGTGCTLSAAIAALLPRYGLEASVERAKVYLTGALEAADRLEVGQGIGPTHHFYQWW